MLPGPAQSLAPRRVGGLVGCAWVGGWVGGKARRPLWVALAFCLSWRSLLIFPFPPPFCRM